MKTSLLLSSALFCACGADLTDRTDEGLLAPASGPHTGTYEINAHEIGCIEPTRNVIEGPGYFRVLTPDASSLALGSCYNPAACDSWNSPSELLGYEENGIHTPLPLVHDNNNSYSEALYSAAIHIEDGVELGCVLQKWSSEVRLVDDQALINFRAQRLLAPDLDEGCTEEAARTREEQMDCVYQRTVAGTRVE